MNEVEVLHEMGVAVGSPKIAGEPTGWKVGNGTSRLFLVLPLDVVPTYQATCRLVFRATSVNPDRDVSATLVVTLAGRDLTAWRFDWRPLHPHLNRVGSKQLKGLLVDTGIHDFASNAALGLERMQAEGLPICCPVEHEPHDYDAFVRLVCDILNVSLTEPVQSPPWSPKLF